MPVPALRLEEPTFREGIANYVTTKCRLLRVPRVEVDDLVQESLIHIIAKVGTFRAEKSEFEQWARGIAWNVIREHLRQAKLYFALFTDYQPNVDDYAAHGPSPERCARQNQARCAIENAAQGISSRQTKVLVLHAVHDMSHQEIGRELCISEAMSQKDYQRARNHLAQCISGKAFSVMPLSLASCEDLPVNDTRSRWTERSHYVGQLAALLMAVFCVSSLNLSTMYESTVMETRILDQVQNVVMYRRDQPTVHLDAPEVKPEPASLPSVPAVSVPTRSGDKRTYVQDLAPLPPYKHDPASDDHLLFGDECP
jgi:RNA polymerase sigma factor (sigma-70 family)